MIDKIANMILTSLGSLSIFDVTAGVAKTISRNVTGDKGTVIKKFPVYINKTKAVCSNEDYIHLIPDSSKMSILYFEENGTSLKGQTKMYFTFTTRLRLVFWCNLKKINETYTGTELIQAYLFKNFPDTLPNTDYICKAYINSITPVEKEVGIFSKYSYDEEEKQYLTYPYDYFAFDFEVVYSIAKECIDDVIIDGALCPTI